MHWFVENVFSMSAANRRAFSATLNCEALLLDAKEFGDMRRPRLYWCSRRVKSDKRGTLRRHADFSELLPKVQQPARGHWVEDGAKMPDGMKFVYTLTRCNPSKDPPR